MKQFILPILALATAPAIFAQNIVGTWQGSLQPPQGKPLRIVIKISRADDESLKAVMYSIDQGGQPHYRKFGDSTGFHVQDGGRRDRGQF